MKLYSYYRSSCSWRVRIALAFKQIEYEYVAIHLLKDEQARADHLRRNPLGQVPVISWDENGQVRSLGQSIAILDWLEIKYPTPRLLPTDPFLRARSIQLAEIVNSGIQPHQNLATSRHLEKLGVDAKAFGAQAISRGLEALERAAADTAGTYLVDDEISWADVCLVPQLYNARRHSVDLSGLAILSRVELACAEHPAFRAAHPDRQPDAES